MLLRCPRGPTDRTPDIARIEYFNDPSAPSPNSIVVAVTAFVRDERRRVLLIRRTDNDLWALPGGAQDFGEFVAETVVRETLNGEACHGVGAARPACPTDSWTSTTTGPRTLKPGRIRIGESTLSLSPP